MRDFLTEAVYGLGILTFFMIVWIGIAQGLMGVLASLIMIVIVGTCVSLIRRGGVLIVRVFQR